MARFYWSEDGSRVIIVYDPSERAVGATREEIANRIGPNEDAVEVSQEELGTWLANNPKPT